MSYSTRATLGMLARSPGPGRYHYLIEQEYFGEQSPGRIEDLTFFERSMRATIRCVARWADRYRAYPAVQRHLVREGRLPDNDLLKEEELGQIVTWLRELPDPFIGAVLNLDRGGDMLLFQGDGFASSVLELTEAEFAVVQDCWDRLGLPRDLYFRADEQHVLVEPVPKYGGVVRRVRRYTPRRWAQRGARLAKELQVPSEPERIERFLGSCADFERALRLRMAELAEPGRETDEQSRQQHAELARISTEVRRLMARIELH